MRLMKLTQHGGEAAGQPLLLNPLLVRSVVPLQAAGDTRGGASIAFAGEPLPAAWKVRETALEVQTEWDDAVSDLGVELALNSIVDLMVTR